jgi:asparagine synthase (glutamine-hydrolysing)
MNENGSSWPTFTIGYGKSFKDDELDDAAETARIFGARHTSIEIDRRTFEEALPRVVDAVEEPVAASSIVPMYFVSERARRDVKVALNGQGPDELFGGYKRHLGVRYGGLWAGLPGWVRKPIASGIGKLPRNEALRRGVNSLATTDRLRRYQDVLSLAPGAEIDGLFKDGVLPESPGDRILDAWSDLVPLMEHTDELGGLQFLELRSTLPDELLVYADKLSMAHSLEVRVPYLDREIVEYVERLKAPSKVRRGVGKWLHRKVCREYLPGSITRRKKRGFAVNVVDDWLRSASSLGPDDAPEISGSLSEVLDTARLMQLSKAHRSGERDHHKLIFSLALCGVLLAEPMLTGMQPRTVEPVSS